MKKLLLVLVASFLMLMASASAGATSVQTVCLRSKYRGVTTVALRRDLPAFQVAANKVTEWWGGTAVSLHVGCVAGDWPITVRGPSLFLGGFHDRGPDGAYAVVFADRNWTIYLSHELEEMMVDPLVNGYRTARGSRLWLVEVADPVEEYFFNYGHVRLSDFVGPNWYKPGNTGPYDLLGMVAYPEEILINGYASYWTGYEWAQIGNFTVR